jgi:alanyl-tRNA synthetase
MVDLFDEKGNLVTAYSEEEVQAKVEQEAARLVEEANATKQAEIDAANIKLEEAETAKAELEEKMAKLDDKSLNFGNLRKKAEEKDAVIEGLKSSIVKLDEVMNQKFSQLSAENNKQKVASLINRVAGNNVELAKKIEFNYNRLNATPKDEKELAQLVNDAVLLSTGGTKPNLFSTDVMSSSGGTTFKQDDGKKLTDTGKQAAKEFGLSDQILKKYNII